MDFFVVIDTYIHTHTHTHIHKEKNVLVLSFNPKCFRIIPVRINLGQKLLSVCLSVCLPACLPVCLSVCLSVCLERFQPENSLFYFRRTRREIGTKNYFMPLQ